MRPSPCVTQSFISCIGKEIFIGNSVDVLLVISVLAIHKRFVKYLVLPHVEIKDHNNEDDAIVEPFSRDANLSSRKAEMKISCV